MHRTADLPHWSFALQGRLKLRQRAGRALQAAAAAATDTADAAPAPASLKIACAASGSGVVKRKALAPQLKLSGSARQAIRRQAADILNRRRATLAGQQRPPTEPSAPDDGASLIADAKPSIGATGGIQRALSVVAPSASGRSRTLRSDLTAEALQAALDAVDSQSVISGKTIRSLGLRLNKEQRRRLKAQLLRQRFETTISGSVSVVDSLPQMDVLERLGAQSAEAFSTAARRKQKKRLLSKVGGKSGQQLKQQRKRQAAAAAEAQRLEGMRAGARGLLFAPAAPIGGESEAGERLKRVAGLL